MTEAGSSSLRYKLEYGLGKLRDQYVLISCSSDFLSKSHTKDTGLLVIAIHYYYHGWPVTKSTCIPRVPEEPGEVMFVSENEKKVRKLWRGEISCAYCGKQNSVKVEKQTIEPAVPAETEIRVTVEKSLQTVLA